MYPYGDKPADTDKSIDPSLMPLHPMWTTAAAVAIGTDKTVTEDDAVLVHPFAPVTVTVYKVVVDA